MDEPVIEQRAKRQKKDKGGRMAAFERLKALKGSKHKCDIQDVDNVYDTVDEKEFQKTAQKYEDWIEGDHGAYGYVEDGRDIFEEDLDADSIAQMSEQKKSKGPKKKKAISENAGRGSGNLHSMLANMPAKKEKEVDLDKDEVLSELLAEIDDSPSTPQLKPKPVSTFSELKAAKDYMSSFSHTKKKPSIKSPPNPIEKSPPKSMNVDENATIVSQVDVEVPAKKNLLFKMVKSEPKVASKPAEVDMLDTLNDDFDFDDGSDVDTTHVQEAELEASIKPPMIEETFETVTPEADADILKEIENHFNCDDNSKQDKICFFWWDAYEDANVQPGVVLLFGKYLHKKSGTFMSCTLIIKNILRKIHVLPRATRKSDNTQSISVMDVHDEFKKIVAQDFKLMEFKAKKVSKKYAFDADVPGESDYLEVRYPAKSPRLPADLSGETFNRIFGTESSYLELFLLENGIKGPCWLEVSNAVESSNPMTHSEVEWVIELSRDVVVYSAESIPAPPPLVVAVINLRVASNNENATVGGSNEIVIASVIMQRFYFLEKKAPSISERDGHFSVMSCPNKATYPADFRTLIKNNTKTPVQVMVNEKALLNYFITQIHKNDPDLIVGHDLQGGQITILCERLRALDSLNYSRLSRVRRANLPKYVKDNRLERTLFTGRLVCDVKVSAKELIKSRSYDLDMLCQNVLKMGENDRLEIDPNDVAKMYACSDDLERLVKASIQDAIYTLRIMYELNAIPLALQITNIAGNVMSRTLMGGRSERNEYLLLHAFHDRNYIVPDKVYKKGKKDDANVAAPSRKKPAYAGGLVLDPQVGFYSDMVLLMDFNSLYPSIIQEFNICFTTITPSIEEEDDENGGNGITLPGSDVAVGVLPTEIRKLVDRRKLVKQLMRGVGVSPEEMQRYEIRQLALKLTANSMYGCLGFTNSRFYAKHLAQLITLKGREILVHTKNKAVMAGYEVIYGDTDSIMINTKSLNYDQVMKIGAKIRLDVNRMYKKVELGIDGVFRYLLLLKKKKYAALVLSKDKSGKIVSTQEHKGLEIVRRDCAKIAVEAGKFVLNHILSEEKKTAEELVDNIHTHLQQLAEDLKENKVPLSLLVITKQLTKDPSLYSNATALPHVTVAQRYNNKGGRKFKAGDTVSYVICEDNTDASAMQRAYHVDEFKRSTGSESPLKVDVGYYLAQQIHPVVSRLCEPIEGTSPEQIADCLGMDSSSYRYRGAQSGGAGSGNSAYAGENWKDPAVRYRDARPFEFKCPKCKQVIAVAQANGADLLACPRCGGRPVEDGTIHIIQNQLTQCVRELIMLYYKHELQCADPICMYTMRTLPAVQKDGRPLCIQCKEGAMVAKYSDRELYMQLQYLHYLFDPTQWQPVPTLPKDVHEFYSRLRGVVMRMLEKSAYGIVDLGKLAQLLGRHKQEKLAKREEAMAVSDRDVISYQDDDDDDKEEDDEFAQEVL